MDSKGYSCEGVNVGSKGFMLIDTSTQPTWKMSSYRNNKRRKERKVETGTKGEIGAFMVRRNFGAVKTLYSLCFVQLVGGYDAERIAKSCMRVTEGEVVYGNFPFKCEYPSMHETTSARY